MDHEHSTHRHGKKCLDGPAVEPHHAGIYHPIWQFKTFKELKNHIGNGIGAGLGLLLAIVFGIVTVFLLLAQVGNMYAAEEQDKPASGATGSWVLLPMAGGIVWLVKVQGALNRHWRGHRQPS